MLSTAEAERAKYKEIWDIPEYEHSSPGEAFVDVFGELASPEEDEGLIDLGCGSGRAGRALAKKYRLNVTYLDFVQVDKQNKPFIKQVLWRPFPSRNPKWSYGFCCDVMEHIPVEYVMLTLDCIRASCRNVFFSISNIPDGFTGFILKKYNMRLGSPLHLTVMPYSWWLSKMREIGEVIDARDLQNTSLFYVRMK